MILWQIALISGMRTEAAMAGCIVGQRWKWSTMAIGYPHGSNVQTTGILLGCHVDRCMDYKQEYNSQMLKAVSL